jgi:hypothetical protein
MLANLARLLVPALCTGALTAQFVNRAAWLGTEEEGVRRNFEQGTEYFLDRFSYVVAPPWWDPGLTRFDERIDLRFGSTSATQFTVEGQLDQAIELGDGFAFRYHVLQSENRDTRYLRNELALEYALGDETALFAQGSLFADKSLIDVSLGAWLLRRDDEALRVMLTAVDFATDKSDVVTYESAPWAAMVSGAFGDTESHRIAFELGAQLPFEVRELGDGDRLELQRWIGSAQSHLRLAERSVLVTAIESEWTAKQLRGTAAGNPLDEDFDRTFHQARVEWWQDAAQPWSIGVLHTWHEEDGRRPNAPANDLRTRRREWFGILRTRFEVDEKLSFEPQLFAGNIRDSFRDGMQARDEDRFEGKIAWNARWDFSPDITLALIVSTQIDELAFGGGGAQFVARF